MSDLDKLSLKKIDVQGNVIGKFSTFSIHQEYTNETEAVLEVTYTFPISATATVTGFTAQIGDKIIKGKVKEKEEARKEYEKAMVRGDSAYLMTNEASNIFRMNIGKIAVGETVVIKIDYIDNLEIFDNQIRLLIPTLVAPRYKLDVIDILSFETIEEVDYRGNVTIVLDKDLKIDDVQSKTHSIKVENNTISAKDIKLDKDFVLDIRLVEQSFSKGYYRDLPNGRKVVYLSFFPEIEQESQPKPKTYIFVIDISGSMTGYKIDQTKEAVIKCLQQLRDGDMFNFIIFETVFELYSEKIIAFNPENFQKAKSYVQELRTRGGTEMFSAVRASLEQFGNEKIIFLFTDGEVGNESKIAGYVRQHIEKSALFVFGIDSSVNKKGLQEIADAGRGKAEFLLRDERLKEIIVRQFARASSSNLYESGLNPKSNTIKDKIEKQRMLFNHEFYDVLLETDAIDDDFELQCKTDEQTYSFVIAKDTLEHLELPLDKIYATEQIRRVEKYIENRPYAENKGFKEQIVEIAVEYQIDSKYTAFIAVNERDEKLPDIPELQDTVLESPAGWDMKMPLYDSGSAYGKTALDTIPAPSTMCCMDTSAQYKTERTKMAYASKAKVYEEPKSTSSFKKKSFFSVLFDNDDEPTVKKPITDVNEEELEKIFQKIKVCEEMLVKKYEIINFDDASTTLPNANEEACQTLLNEIILLIIHLRSPNSKVYRAWIKKIRKEAHHVFMLVKKHL